MNNKINKSRIYAWKHISSIIFCLAFLIIPNKFYSQTTIARILSESQDFIVPDDAPNEEYIGIIKVYPEFKIFGTAPTFQVTGGNTETFAVSETGIITVTDATKLDNGTNPVMKLNVNISKSGFSDTEISVTIYVLDADKCTFIDPSAVTNGTGTRADPRNVPPTLANSNQILLFKRGTTIILTNTISADGVDTTLIASYGTGDLPKITWSVSGNRLFSVGRGGNGFTVRDLELTTDNPAADGSNWVTPIYGYAYGGAWKNLNILHCYIHHSGGLSAISNDPEPDAENVKIEWIELHDINVDGIYVKNVHGTTDINNNYLHRINLNYHFVGHTEQEAPGDGIQTDDSQITNIRHNVIDRSFTGNKFCMIIGTNEEHSGAITISDNYLIGPNPPVALMYLYIRVTSQADHETIVTRNYFHGPGTAVYGALTEAIVSYNIFDQNDIGIHHDIAKVYNNVFYGTTTCLDYGGLEFKNNIVYFTASGQKAYNYYSNIESDYNLYNQEQTDMFGAGRSTVESQRPGDESNSKVGDPMFKDVPNSDFRVEPGSPALGKGTFVELKKDFLGNTVAYTPNIGASDNDNPNTSIPQKKVTRPDRFFIYPNPSNGSFTIYSEANPPGSLKIKIYDTIGKIIYESDFFQFNGSKFLNISLPKNLVLIQLITDLNYQEFHYLIIQ